MQVVNHSEFCKNLSSALDYVEDTRAPVIVKRGKNSAVVISLDDYNAFIETDYLLSNPANAEHLMRGVQAVKNRKLIQKVGLMKRGTIIYIGKIKIRKP